MGIEWRCVFYVGGCIAWLSKVCSWVWKWWVHNMGGLVKCELMLILDNVNGWVMCTSCFVFGCSVNFLCCVLWLGVFITKINKRSGCSCHNSTTYINDSINDANWAIDQKYTRESLRDGLRFYYNGLMAIFDLKLVIPQTFNIYLPNFRKYWSDISSSSVGITITVGSHYLIELKHAIIDLYTKL